MGKLLETGYRSPVVRPEAVMGVAAERQIPLGGIKGPGEAQRDMDRYNNQRRFGKTIAGLLDQIPNRRRAR